jgi:hypothetical protein
MIQRFVQHYKMKALRKEEEIGEKKEYLAGSINLNVLVQKQRD